MTTRALTLVDDAAPGSERDWRWQRVRENAAKTQFDCVFVPLCIDGRNLHLSLEQARELDPESGLNLIAFSSGWGDGCYPSYWGLDAQGQATCLLTDFRVIEPG